MALSAAEKSKRYRQKLLSEAKAGETLQQQVDRLHKAAKLAALARKLPRWIVDGDNPTITVANLTDYLSGQRTIERAPRKQKPASVAGSRA